jgi:hypothetical protein
MLSDCCSVLDSVDTSAVLDYAVCNRAVDRCSCPAVRGNGRVLVRENVNI